MPRDPDEAPLFPLPRGAILPGELLPLHVFEPRYRAMMEVVREGAQLIAVGTLLPGLGCDDEGRAAVGGVVGIGRLVRDEQNDDGTSDIVLHGVTRGRITDELPTSPFRTVRFERQARISDVHPAEAFRLRRDLLQGIATRASEPLDFDVTAAFDVGTLADRIASSLRLSPGARVAMMQAFGLEQRVDTLLRLLDEPRHRARLVDLVPSLGDFTLSLTDGKDTAP